MLCSLFWMFELLQSYLMLTINKTGQGKYQIDMFNIFSLIMQGLCLCAIRSSVEITAALN